MIKRILITGDLLRPPIGGQDENIDWMLQVLGPPLSEVTGLSVDPVRADSIARHLPEIYRSFGQTFDNPGWASICHQSPSAQLVELLAPLFQDSLVLSFECPHVLAAALRRLTVPLIEILVSPVRFYSDLLLAFRSSAREVHQAISRHQVRHSELERAAGSIRHQLSPGDDATAAFSLITVQVPWDRSVIHDGQFASILDFPHQLEAFVNRANRVCIKPHPDIGVPADVAEWACARSIPNLERKFYEIVASPHLGELLSLSSSTLDEAEAFGVPTCRLLPRVHEFSYAESRCDPHQFLTVFEDFLLPPFWSDALSSILETRPVRARSSGPSVNLRTSRGVMWDWRPEFSESLVHA